MHELFQYKVRKQSKESYYIIMEKIYKGFVCYTLSRGFLFLALTFLKWEGVRPVVFLNWLERC